MSEREPLESGAEAGNAAGDAGLRNVGPEPERPVAGETRRFALGLGALAVLAGTTAWLGTGARGVTGAPAASATDGSATSLETPLPATGAAAPHLNLGFFANVTHAPALVAESRGLFARHAGAHGTTHATQVFNAGPATIEALSAGAVDAAYLGPSPALNSYVKSAGRSLLVLAGATSGGASLVVNPRFADVAALLAAESVTLASPQLGGTQDVALRTWLRSQGVTLKGAGGSERFVINAVDNAQTLALYEQGRLDGAWLPEPWATRLVAAGARRLIDERTLWPGGVFPTTVLVMQRDFAIRYPQTAADLVAANSESIAWLRGAGPAAAGAIAAALAAQGATLAEEIIAESVRYLEFTPDPLTDTYATLLQNAVAAGLAEPVNATALHGLVAVQEATP
ncbi:ABC transporter substrate-binding protein [Micrococcales bacterium 31B]|nr:ABC transporter substrate-binding protein [Micrococcales bacterium 31B]